jgi:hypothetical protein
MAVNLLFHESSLLESIFQDSQQREMFVAERRRKEVQPPEHVTISALLNSQGKELPTEEVTINLDTQDVSSSLPISEMPPTLVRSLPLPDSSSSTCRVCKKGKLNRDCSNLLCQPVLFSTREVVLCRFTQKGKATKVSPTLCWYCADGNWKAETHLRSVRWRIHTRTQTHSATLPLGNWMGFI